MLRTRKTYSMLDQAKGGAGSSQFGGLQALSAEQLAALEGEVVYCLPPPGAPTHDSSTPEPGTGACGRPPTNRPLL